MQRPSLLLARGMQRPSLLLAAGEVFPFFWGPHVFASRLSRNLFFSFLLACRIVASTHAERQRHEEADERTCWYPSNACSSCTCELTSYGPWGIRNTWDACGSKRGSLHLGVKVFALQAICKKREPKYHQKSDVKKKHFGGSSITATTVQWSP